MPSICFYFQVHQPLRLRPFPFQWMRARKEAMQYFDEARNREIFLKVACKCYGPTNRKLLEMIERHDGNFRVAFSLSGIAIEQMKRYAPEVLESFRALAGSGCVEFLSETYYHTLAGIYDPREFKEQVLLHRDLIEKTFGQKPRIIRNTELVYSDEIGRVLAGLGFRGVLAEGADDILDWRSPNFLYRHPDKPLVLLLKNYRLSDDIAFRFSNRGWKEWPLTAPKFADWIHQISGNGEVVNLFMDYETFGEHQWSDTGIFAFLEHLPAEILRRTDWDFKTPSEVVAAYRPIASLSFPRLTSWADLERDLSAWNGNEMQKRALAEIYALDQAVREHNNAAATAIWRKLQTSDHFYYMCTKWFSDGDVHAYFSPYKSPYEAFLNYMSVLSNFRECVLVLGENLNLGRVA